MNILNEEKIAASIENNKEMMNLLVALQDDEPEIEPHENSINKSLLEIKMGECHHNAQLRKAVKKNKDRIIYMHNNHLSNRKIQILLTKECIDNNEIPPEVIRFNRRRGAKNEGISVPSLLPISAIKKIIQG